MATTRRFLYHLLNQKRVAWLVISIATISKSILVAAFSNYEADKSFYLLVAKNLSAGKGFTIPVTLLNNPGITQNIYLPSASSPLYSIIAAPLLKLFPDNYFLVTWLIESLSWLLFFLVLHKLLLKVTREYFWTNLFILFSGFFLYTVEFSSAPKDVLAMALLFAALLRCVTIGQLRSHRSFIYLFGTAFLFFLPGLMKYTYLPLAIVFPLSILIIGFLKKEKLLFRQGIITLLLSVILVTAFSFYFYSYEKQHLVLYADFFYPQWSVIKSGNEFTTGFFPENLGKMYAFIPSALVNLDMLGVQVKMHLYPFYHTLAIVLLAINFIGLTAFVAAFFYLLKRFYRKPISDRMVFLLTGMFISISLITLLCFMSVRYQAVEYKFSHFLWTYVTESRSFLFPIVFLQVCLFVFLFAKKQMNSFLRWLRLLLLFIAGISCLHGVYFVAKKAISLRHPPQKPMSVNKLVTIEAGNIKKTNPEDTVWLATEMAHLSWYAKLHKQKVFNNLSFLNDSSFRLPPKTILLTAVGIYDTANISSYLRRSDVKQYRNYDSVYIVFRQDAPRIQ